MKSDWAGEHLGEQMSGDEQAATSFFIKPIAFLKFVCLFVCYPYYLVAGRQKQDR